MLSIDQMRSALYDAYSSKTWQDKVTKMSDNQVIVVFRNLRRRGTIR